MSIKSKGLELLRKFREEGADIKTSVKVEDRAGLKYTVQVEGVLEDLSRAGKVALVVGADEATIKHTVKGAGGADKGHSSGGKVTNMQGGRMLAGLYSEEDGVDYTPILKGGKAGPDENHPAVLLQGMADIQASIGTSVPDAGKEGADTAKILADCEFLAKRAEMLSAKLPAQLSAVGLAILNGIAADMAKLVDMAKPKVKGKAK